MVENFRKRERTGEFKRNRRGVNVWRREVKTVEIERGKK